MNSKEIASKKAKFSEEAEAFAKFMVEFQQEGDRAAVILGAAKIDTLLYLLLKKVLLPNVSASDELFDGDSPLSTLNTKINMAYRLGLIDAQFARALHLIRKIRNAFAHELVGSNLNSGAHRDRALELAAPLQSDESFQTLKKLISEKFQGVDSPSVRCRAALVLLINTLDAAIPYAKPMDGTNAVPLI